MSHSVGRGVELVLSGDERDQLLAWSRGSSRLAVRARIVLACTEPGVSDERVAANIGVSRMTVQVWRRRFAGDRLAGLSDRARPGRPKAELVFSDGEREQLTRWSRRAKSAQALALRARIILACAAPGATNKAGGGRVAGDGAHGRQVAAPVRRQPVGRLDRRAAAGSAAVDPAGQGRGGGRRDTGGDAEGCDALVAHVDGGEVGPVQVDDRADLAPL